MPTRAALHHCSRRGHLSHRGPWLIATLLAAMLTAAAAAPATRPTEPVVEFKVERADTLIGLSRDVLVTPDAWREVARLNRLPNANRVVPGQVLLIPARLMRARPVPAKLVSSNGDVRVGDAPAVEGSTLSEGQTVQTGPGSSAVVELADGSRLRLPPSSLAQVIASQNLGARPADAGSSSTANPDPARSGWFSGALRVLSGSVEIFAAKVLRARPLEVVTPTAVVGVRGTGFRVGFTEAANGSTRVEVVEGQVRFDASAKPAGADVAAGFGSTTNAAGGPPRVVKLLDAPDLSGLPERFERPIVRFALPGETTALRVQVAADAAFDKIVSDQRVEPGAELRIAGLGDATWQLRSRRIDAQGLEGFDANRSFVLKARPEPPAYLQPRSDSKQAVGSIAFSWASNIEASQVRIQVADDAAFTNPLQDRKAPADAALRIDIAKPGLYFWRLASLRGNADAGPFGDVQRFELRPTPEAPTGGLAADGRSMVFTWSARTQDRQQVQLARDPEFKEVTAEAELTAAEWTLPTPERSGRYFFRYRSIEPDGFVSPYSSTLTIEVPRDWSGLWLLLPLLLML